MVTQPETSMTSSTPDFYDITGVAFYEANMPKTLEVKAGRAKNDESLVGTLSREQVDQSRWPQLPHLALANLPTYDAQGVMNMNPPPPDFDEHLTEDGVAREVELARQDPSAAGKFVKTYGVLREKDAIHIRKGHSIDQDLELDGVPLVERADVRDIAITADDYAIFRLKVSDLAFAQRLLRLAWIKNTAAIDIYLKEEIHTGFKISGFDITPGFAFRRKGSVGVYTEDLWTFICFLAVLDYARGRTGFCENPDCVAPYYLKKRRTQKICESGPCTAWAQRQYALNWWNKEGKKRRAKAQEKRRKKKER
jgi:hypothetical protein